MAQEAVTSVYKMYLSGAGSRDIDFRADGRIVGFSLEINITTAGVTAPSYASAELSFIGTQDDDAQDVRHSLAALHVGHMATTPDTPSSRGITQTGLSVPVFHGERLYLHQSLTGTSLNANAYAYLYVEDGLDDRPRRS